MQPVSKLIEVQGPIGTLGDGYAMHNRAFIKMLYNAGYNVKAISMEPGVKGAPMSEDPTILRILNDAKNKGSGDIIFNFSIPPLYRVEPNKVNLAFSSWETNMVPAIWVNKINTLTALFVPSLAVKQVFATSGVTVPIYVLPFPLLTENYNTNSQGISVMPSIERQYTFMYTGTYTPRKNYEDLVAAFCDTFDGIQDVALVIKTIAPNNDVATRMQIQGAISALANKMNGCHKRPKIIVATDQLEDQDMLSMFQGVDAYVTTSRGEGLDLSLVQAMSLGKLVICDNYLGHSDYVTEDNAIIFKHTYRPVIDSGNPYHNSKHKWTSPDYISLCQSLVNAYQILRSDKGVKIGTNAKNTVVQKYSEVVVAEQFNKDLLKIVGPDEPKTRASTWPKIPQMFTK